MVERIIICNLSPLHFSGGQDGVPLTLLPKKTYVYNDAAEDIAYVGIQTNQAPVKCLVERAFNKDRNPVTTIVNLFSRECELEHDPYVNELGELDTRTDENYFVDSIVEYCENEHIPCPEFKRVPYDTDNPAKSLEQLIEALNVPGATVDIDTTGGLRNAATLIALALQTIKAKPAYASVGLRIGRIVYSNYRSGTIAMQRDTYALVDLASAISAFTSYGKADQLCGYFDDENASDLTKKLCSELRTFSEKLSLCNTELKASVDRINRLLNSLSEAPKDELTSSELLFVSLIPSFRESFVRGGEHLVPNLIRWCVERQMLQQALTLIRERIPEYLVNQGLMKFYNGAIAEDVEQFCLGRNNDNGLEIVNEQKLASETEYASEKARRCMVRPCDYANAEYVDVPADTERKLAGALVWYRYTWLIRNNVMHAGEDTDINKYRYFLRDFRGKYGERKYLKVSQSGTTLVPQAQTAENLTDDLLCALSFFEIAGHARQS